MSANKPQDSFFTTGRMEAFSDGVIAIIITLMILEVHAPTLDENGDFTSISGFMHHVGAYTLSFIMLGIYWVNHHNFFHKVKYGDRKLLWMNLNLLFWMSLIPLPTGFLGNYYEKPIASVFYGIVLFMTSVSFTLMGSYASKNGLFSGQVPVDIQKRNMRRNRLGLALYLAAMGLAYVSVYISFGIFIFIAAMYFMPRLGIIQKKEAESSSPEPIVEKIKVVEESVNVEIENAITPNSAKADAGTKDTVKPASPAKKAGPKK